MNLDRLITEALKYNDELESISNELFNIIKRHLFVNHYAKLQKLEQKYDENAPSELLLRDEVEHEINGQTYLIDVRVYNNEPRAEGRYNGVLWDRSISIELNISIRTALLILTSHARRVRVTSIIVHELEHHNQYVKGYLKIGKKYKKFAEREDLDGNRGDYLNSNIERGAHTMQSLYRIKNAFNEFQKIEPLFYDAISQYDELLQHIILTFPMILDYAQNVKKEAHKQTLRKKIFRFFKEYAIQMSSKKHVSPEQVKEMINKFDLFVRGKLLKSSKS